MDKKASKNIKETTDKAKKAKTSKKPTKAKSEKPTSKAKEVEKLTAELSDLNDKHLRLQAEFDNYRKRTLQEKMELIQSGGKDILTGLLPTLDNFERAMQSMQDSSDTKAIKDGINLIYNGFKDFLTQKGIKEMDAKEKDFDTDFHEALTKIPAPTEELKGKNIDVIEKGYTLNDKIIRFAKVVVGE